MYSDLSNWTSPSLQWKVKRDNAWEYLMQPDTQEILSEYSTWTMDMITLYYVTDTVCITTRIVFIQLTKTLKMSQNNMMDYKTDVQK